jgi:hypothetical protein
VLVKTAAQALARVISLADLTGQTTGSDPRHPEADLLLVLNDSYRMVREHYTTVGFREYIEPTTPLTGPAAPETDETYGVVDYPTSALSLQGFDVFDPSTSEWEPLEEIDWEERRTFQTQRQPRRPGFYSLRSFGSVSGATEAAGKIAFFPFVASMTYRLHILPEWTDITDTAHKFIFPSPAGFDLMVMDAVWKVSGLRDGDKQKRVALAAQGIVDAKSRIGSYVPRVTNTGPKTIRRARNWRSGNW